MTHKSVLNRLDPVKPVLATLRKGRSVSLAAPKQMPRHDGTASRVGGLKAAEKACASGKNSRKSASNSS